MKLVLNILFILVLLGISYQDFKDRLVSIFLLLSGIILGGWIHFLNQNIWSFFTNISFNLLVIIIVFSILFLYAKYKMKQDVFETFGQGDLLFFLLIAMSFPIVSFLMIFVFSMVFSLLIYIFIKNNLKERTVPLAGLQSVFLVICILANLAVPSVQLYIL